MGVGVAAHGIDRAGGGASADGIGVATWMFGGDGDGAIRAANSLLGSASGRLGFAVA